MMKPSLKITTTSFLIILLIQEGIILIDTLSTGKTQEKIWYKQWPFQVETENFSETTSEFAYNGTHVELLIGLANKEKSHEKLSAIITQNNGYLLNQISLDNKTQNVKVTIPTNDVLKFLKEVENSESTIYVEPVWKFSLDTIPNDPAWINQWGPAKIEADAAWNIQKGSKQILVAVVDTGIYYKHPDLSTNYVALGYDWVNDDNDPIDDHGHGTHCAGIIAATLNNSVGIAGLAQVRVMAEKGFAANGQGYSDDLANAIVHATNQGANIISCSWGSTHESQLIHDAIKYATSRGVLVIAAAGNSGSETRNYPAAYPEVIAVTATNENDKPASFTSYGDWVDIAAPGTSIYSTYLWNTYVSLSGTSMACPHVAGVAALVWSQYPTMNSEQIQTQLLSTADDLGAVGFDVYYGYGRVNAKKALNLAVSLISSKVFNAPANTVYFIQKSPENASAMTVYDSIASGIIYGLTKNIQKQIFTSANNFVLSTGELNASYISNATLVLFGGPCAQKTVSYYENVGVSPVKFASNSTHYMFTTQNNIVVASLSIASANSGHEDMFVIEVFMDNTNLIIVMYGFSWKGTWASSIYFKEMISKNFNNYSEEWYVFHWVDSGLQDGIPEITEIHQESP